MGEGMLWGMLGGGLLGLGFCFVGKCDRCRFWGDFLELEVIYLVCL